MTKHNCGLVVFVLVLLTQIGCMQAQEFDKVKLDAYFAALDSNQRFMGSVAIAKDGKLIYENSIGYVDVAGKKKADANTKYRVGSISKTFTATLVFKAIEEKKLTLDQTINKWFPAVKYADKITIRQLLNHSSGIHNYTDSTFITWNTQSKTEAELLQIIIKGGSDFEPGSKSEYSNSNYVLLTFILEKSYKASYAALLKKYITAPLNLTNTGVGGKINTAGNEAFSYSFSGEKWELEDETDMSIPLGAGAVVSSAADIVRFAEGLFNGKLIKSENIEMMKKIHNGYGSGLFSFPFYERTTYGHTGGIDGFRSIFSYNPVDGAVYAQLGNGLNFNINDISIVLLSAIYNRPYSIPVFGDVIQLSEADLQALTGVYASTQIPLKITIAIKDGKLTGQATGQPAFPLEATSANTFKFDGAGIVMDFNKAERRFKMKQGGQEFLFTKE